MYKPIRLKRGRGANQTLVGKLGEETDVGGHLQAVAFGGSSDRFNLIPQNAKFNRSAFRSWENEILRNIDNVDKVRMTLIRNNDFNSRPESIQVEYWISGKWYKKIFTNEEGG